MKYLVGVSQITYYSLGFALSDEIKIVSYANMNRFVKYKNVEIAVYKYVSSIFILRF